MLGFFNGARLKSKVGGRSRDAGEIFTIFGVGRALSGFGRRLREVRGPAGLDLPRQL